MTDDDLEKTVKQKISEYHPNGHLDTTALFILELMKVNHGRVQSHCERVALLSEEVANVVQINDPKATFFAGLFHDIGKLLLPYSLFQGENITQHEYDLVKNHAMMGFESLKNTHLFVAFCAGCHHAMYTNGYGLTIRDFPNDWCLSTISKVLNISMVISVCDFVDAYKSRKTEIKDPSSIGLSLKEMLNKKYNNNLLSKTAIGKWDEMFTGESL